ncbi:MAG: hypothetical protein ACFFDN_14080 [Candidatus Hodarchaeota archaeon]
MNEDATREKFLSNSLEKIIFNENDFNTLKQTINDLTLGLIDSKKLKQTIINSRFRLLEELLEFFPFYLKHDNFQNSVEEFTKESENPDAHLIEELREKDEFLQELGHRIDNIFNMLKSKINKKLESQSLY